MRSQSKGVQLQPALYNSLAKRLPSLGCETAYYTGDFSFGYHVPHPQNLNGTTVTLFRNPYSRVISSFLYGKGEHQIMFPLGFPNRANVKFALREQIRASQYPILTYAQLPGIVSCQTKMVLSKECGAPVTFSTAELKEAERRIRYDFAFVGLTEESEASARLFLAMYRPIRSTDVVNDPTVQDALVSSLHSAPRVNNQHTAALNKELLSVLRQHQWRDLPDEYVYRVAVQVFFERCARYGIATSHTKEALLQF